MPEESHGLPFAPGRRRFLVDTCKLLALTALATLPLVGIRRWLRIKPDQSQVSSIILEPPLSSNRIPIWHPRCSAYHRDGLLTIRVEAEHKTFEQVMLTDTQARLWCLCGGKWSETELVTTLARERDIAEDEAAREVASFLRPLYQQEFLIAAERGQLIEPLVREIDGSISAGEILWQRNID
jgi:hypothetical protein